MVGTKIAANVFNVRRIEKPFFAATGVALSVFADALPCIRLFITENTFAAVPMPTITCCCSPLKITPLTPSICLSASASNLSLSFKTKRMRVIQ